MFVIDGVTQPIAKRKGNHVIYKTRNPEAAVYLPTAFDADTEEGRKCYEYYVRKTVEKTKTGAEFPKRSPFYIAVESGQLLVPKTQPDLIAYLDALIEVKGDEAWIYREDLAADALEAVNREKNLFEAKALIIGKDAKDEDALKEIAKSYGYKNEFAEPQEVQNFLLNMAKTRPLEFLQRAGNASTKVKAMLNDAVSAKLIVFNNNAWYLLDENNKQQDRLTNVRVGSDSIAVLADWITKEENLNYREMLTEHVLNWRKANGGGTEGDALATEAKAGKRGNPNFGKKA